MKNILIISNLLLLGLNGFGQEDGNYSKLDIITENYYSEFVKKLSEDTIHKDTLDVLESLNKLIEKNTNSGNLYYLRGYYYALKKDFYNGRKDADKAIEIFSKSHNVKLTIITMKICNKGSNDPIGVRITVLA